MARNVRVCAYGKEINTFKKKITKLAGLIKETQTK